MKMTRKQALEYLNSRSRRNSATGCLVWALSTGSHGYAQGYDGETVVLAHRLRWWAEGRRLPLGKSNRSNKVLHTCDNRRCNEISHLFLGTNTDNCHDKMAKGRAGYGETHRQAISDAHQRSGYAAFTPDEVRGIRASAETIKKIAVRLGVSSNTIRQIRNHVTYKWVEA